MLDSEPQHQDSDPELIEKHDLDTFTNKILVQKLTSNCQNAVLKSTQRRRNFKPGSQGLTFVCAQAPGIARWFLEVPKGMQQVAK